MNQYQMAVPCLLGVEGFVADELRAMEAQNVEPQNGRVLLRAEMSCWPARTCGAGTESVF